MVEANPNLSDDNLPDDVGHEIGRPEIDPNDFETHHAMLRGMRGGPGGIGMAEPISSDDEP